MFDERDSAREAYIESTSTRVDVSMHLADALQALSPTVICGKGARISVQRYRAEHGDVASLSCADDPGSAVAHTSLLCPHSLIHPLQEHSAYNAYCRAVLPGLLLVLLKLGTTDEACDGGGSSGGSSSGSSSSSSSGGGSSDDISRTVLHMVDQGTELICRELLQNKRTNSGPSYRVVLFTPNDGGGGSGCSRVMVPKGLVGTAHERGYLTETDFHYFEWYDGQDEDVKNLGKQALFARYRNWLYFDSGGFDMDGTPADREADSLPGALAGLRGCRLRLR